MQFPADRVSFKNSDEIRPNLKQEWVVTLSRTDYGIFSKQDIDNLFDLAWRQNFSSTIYGHAIKENRWTFANGGDSPEAYDKIEIGVDLLEVFNEEKTDFSPTRLQQYITELNERIRKIPGRLKINAEEPAPEATKRAKELARIFSEFNEDAIIVLKSTSAFNGRKAWDALQSVGLSWGDGDYFHWSVYSNKHGHDELFDVWTNTTPGYFLPEMIKEDKMNPKDLVFGFSIPRSVDANNILAIMLETVKYCKSKLGGEILDKHGYPYNEEKEKQLLINFLAKMRATGINPGSNNALTMF